MEKENLRINSLKDLFDTLRQLIMYRKDILVLYSIEKLIILSSALLLTGVLCIIGGLILLHLSFTLSYLLAPYVGSVATSHLVITAILILVGFIIYLNRKKVIVQPITRFLTQLFLTE